MKYSGKHGFKGCFLPQVIKENAELSTDCCGCSEFLARPTVKKTVLQSLVCRNIYKQLPDEINYTADHPSVFPEVSS